MTQDSVAMVRDLFRDQQSTEFIIATIPTVLGVRESARLAAALKKDSIACKRIIVNQVPAASAACCTLMSNTADACAIMNDWRHLLILSSP